MKTKNTLVGVANCLRLHIYSEPSTDSEVICKVRYLTEVEIDSNGSTEDFYKIYTAIGVEGFCQKEYITLK